MTNIQLSIITPTFNRKHLIEKSILSSLEVIKFGKMGEIIIVDDASSDGTVSFLNEKFKQEIDENVIKIFSLNENVGVTGAKNYGAKKAQYEWLVFMDSDDIFLPDISDILVEELKKLERHSLIFFRCISMSSHKLIGRSQPAQDLTIAKIMNDETPGECLPVLKRDVFTRHPYMGELRGCEGIAYLSLLNDQYTGYISDKVIRGYDDSGVDRLSVKSNIKSRAKFLMRYHLLTVKYYKYMTPKNVAKKFAKIIYYWLYK